MKKIMIVFLLLLICFSIFACSPLSDDGDGNGGLSDNNITDGGGDQDNSTQTDIEIAVQNLTESAYGWKNMIGEDKWQWYELWIDGVITQAKTEIADNGKSFSDIRSTYRDKIRQIATFFISDLSIGTNSCEMNWSGRIGSTDYTVFYTPMTSLSSQSMTWGVKSDDLDVGFKCIMADGTLFEIKNAGEKCSIPTTGGNVFGALVIKDQAVLGYTVWAVEKDLPDAIRSVSYTTTVSEEQAMSFIESFVNGVDGEAESGVAIAPCNTNYHFALEACAPKITGFGALLDNPAIEFFPEQSQLWQESDFDYEVTTDLIVTQDGDRFSISGEKSGFFFALIKDHGEKVGLLAINVEVADGVYEISDMVYYTFSVKDDQSDIQEIPTELIDALIAEFKQREQ